VLSQPSYTYMGTSVRCLDGLSLVINPGVTRSISVSINNHTWGLRGRAGGANIRLIKFEAIVPAIRMR